jgi:hypothetical protein
MQVYPCKLNIFPEENLINTNLTIEVKTSVTYCGTSCMSLLIPIVLSGHSKENVKAYLYLYTSASATDTIQFLREINFFYLKETCFTQYCRNIHNKLPVCLYVRPIISMLPQSGICKWKSIALVMCLTVGTSTKRISKAKSFRNIFRIEILEKQQ